MPYSLDNKLVIAVASSALFDLAESDRVYRQEGDDAYRRYQREHQTATLSPGVAFNFVRHILSLNAESETDPFIEVILLSRNDPDTGLRVMHSINDCGLPITRAMFLAGRSPYPYIPAFNVQLFLTANEGDVRDAIAAGYPAGQVVGSVSPPRELEEELRIAFDFDGVLANDDAERVFAESGNDVAAFSHSEAAQAHSPLAAGPLKPLLQKLAKLQAQTQADESPVRPPPRVRIAIITARGAPAHERVVTSLRSWGLRVDETFFLGGVSKERVLEVYKPHIFFDDQIHHLDGAGEHTVGVHVPFGIRNQPQRPA